MSWIEELGKVYELCLKNTESSGLLPIAHSTANAQITVSLNADGSIPQTGFAQRVAKEDTVTVIPVTEASGTRSGTFPPPHPLADKLVYIAGDYPKYSTAKRADNTKFYEAYMKQLGEWCDSEYSHPAVRAVYAYLSNGTLIADLISCGVLTADPDTGKLSSEKINAIAQEDCFVRFTVDGVDTWRDTTLFDSFIRYNSSSDNNVQLCYATGKPLVPTYKHPSKIRNAGDKAKLFSTNDESGFSYRGRFTDKTEATSISYEFSQKMHNALKWLVDEQGVPFGDLSVIVWESALQDVPDMVGDDELFGFDESDVDYSSGKNNKNLLIKSIYGSKNAFSSDSKTMIMALDSATPGRIAMTMYSELPTSEYIENLAEWHSSTQWVRFSKPRSFSMYEIALCAFGTEQGGKPECKSDIRKETVQRLIPCAAERRRVPRDIVRTLCARACRPTAYKEEYWRRILNCACGMLKKQIIEERGDCSMALDTECRSRDYIYGRLLAVADAAEASTYEKGSERTTNAKRFFEAFSNHPYTTWAVIMKNLRPYLDRMPYNRKVYYEKLINQITELADHSVFTNNAPLKPEFLHAYSCQINELYKKHNKNETETNDMEE